MPVYNEAKLLPLCLNEIKDFVDEIVIIDGGPNGPSTDDTKSISESCDKVKYLSGMYKTIPGAWDVASQKNIGISEATGDVFLFLSADMVFSNPERLCELIRDNEDFKVFFCPIIEFWLDMQHARMYGQVGKLSLPSGVQEAYGVARDLQPLANDHGSLDTNTIPKIKEQVIISDVYKFHLGWIRSFSEQINKHIRHVRQGFWGEEGSKLLTSTEQKLEQWAILHVLTYKQVPNIDLKIGLPERLNEIKDMNYLDGQDSVIESYKTKYGSSPFRGLKNE